MGTTKSKSASREIKTVSKLEYCYKLILQKPPFDECCHGCVDLLVRVSRTDLNSDASLATRHHREAERDNKDALSKHHLGHLLVQLLVPQHHRTDGMFLSSNCEASVSHRCAESGGVGPNLVHQLGTFEEHVKHLAGTTNNRRRQRVREGIWPRSLSEKPNELATATSITTSSSTKCLPQGRVDDIYCSSHAKKLLSSSASFSKEASRVTLINEN